MKLSAKVLLALAALLLLALPGQPALGQNVTTGTMTGVVTDASGGVLPGATVVAVHTPTGTTYEAVTRGDGHYSFINVRVGGPYTVTVTMTGFRAKETPNVNVSLGEDRRLDVTLQLDTVQETVNVVAEAQIIDPARAGTASNIGNEAIQSLPTVNRSLFDYARLSPHFVINPVGTDASSISVAGRNDRYNNIQIDGAVNNDVFGLASSGTPGGQTSTEPISIDAIQELQLVVSAYDVRQGGFSGGSVNAITKSGSNNIHGTAYYFGRNQSLVGVGPNDRKFGTFSNKQFGASVGGPVLKNKLFYFGNFEISRKNTPSGTSIAGSGANFGRTAEVDRFLSILENKYGYDPGSKDEFTKTTDSNKFFARADVNISNRHQLTVRHNYVKGLNDIGSPSISSFIFPDNYYRMNSATNSSVAQLNSTIGSAFNELRVTYQRIRDFRDNPGAPKPFPMVRATLSDNSSLTAGTEEFSTANELDQDVIELTDDVTLVRGRHTITLGTHNEFYKFRNLFIRDNFGYYQFSSLDMLEQGLAQSFDYSFGTNDQAFAARFAIRQFSLYAGDQWRVKNNLSVSYGVRFDTPSFPDKPTANPAAQSYFGYGTDTVPVDRIFSPRAGFNWQVNQARREQVRGGVGIFSGRTPYVWLSNQYGNTGIEITRLRVSYNNNNRVAFVPDALGQPTSVGAAQTNEIDLVDPNYKYPRVIRGNLAYRPRIGLLGPGRHRRVHLHAQRSGHQVSEPELHPGRHQRTRRPADVQAQDRDAERRHLPDQQRPGQVVERCREDREALEERLHGVGVVSLQPVLLDHGRHLEPGGLQLGLQPEPGRPEQHAAHPVELRRAAPHQPQRLLRPADPQRLDRLLAVLQRAVGAAVLDDLLLGDRHQRRRPQHERPALHPEERERGHGDQGDVRSAHAVAGRRPVRQRPGRLDHGAQLLPPALDQPDGLPHRGERADGRSPQGGTRVQRVQLPEHVQQGLRKEPVPQQQPELGHPLRRHRQDHRADDLQHRVAQPDQQRLPALVHRRRAVAVAGAVRRPLPVLASR